MAQLVGNRNDGAYKLSHTWDKLLIPQTVKPKNAVKNTSKAKPATIQQPAANQSVLMMTTEQ